MRPVPAPPKEGEKKPVVRPPHIVRGPVPAPPREHKKVVHKKVVHKKHFTVPDKNRQRHLDELRGVERAKQHQRDMQRKAWLRKHPKAKHHRR
ncbi:MAG: hypothetical protein JSS72_13325 [Armatimonadetes bacterium]|nr:hypothetical protein [Armatimonadota bacterium]